MIACLLPLSRTTHLMGRPAVVGGGSSELRREGTFVISTGSRRVVPGSSEAAFESHGESSSPITTSFSGQDIEPEPEAAAVVFGARIALARRYIAALASDGVVRGLIGPREAGRLWSRHVLNSAVVAELLTAAWTVIDVGSGAGLPGIPLAIARPDCQFVLVEPLERRVIFLREVVEALELVNCRVIRGRADHVIDECGAADVVTSRAVAPLERLASWSAPLLRVGGELLALKGSSAAAEMLRDGSAVASLGLIDLEVVSVGKDLVEPQTLVIRGYRVSTSGKAKGRKSVVGDDKRARPARRPRNM